MFNTGIIQSIVIIDTGASLWSIPGKKSVYLEESAPVRPIDQMNVSHADDQVSNPGKSSEMPSQLPVLNDYLTCRQPGIIPRQYSSEMLTQLPVLKPDSLHAYLGQTIFSLPFPVRST